MKSITKENLLLKFKSLGYEYDLEKGSCVEIDVLPNQSRVVLNRSSIEISGLYDLEIAYKDVFTMNIVPTDFRLFFVFYMVNGEKLIHGLPTRNLTKGVIVKNSRIAVFLREAKNKQEYNL